LMVVHSRAEEEGHRYSATRMQTLEADEEV
jgi:hypothetical protein